MISQSKAASKRTQDLKAARYSRRAKIWSERAMISRLRVLSSLNILINPLARYSLAKVLRQFSRRE